jgi:hypothetical protein
VLTPATFAAAFPMFAAVNATTVQRHITASTPWFDVSAWGALFDEGQGNWIAHRIVTEAVDTWQISSPAGDRPALAAPGDREVTMKQVDTTVVAYSAMLLKDQIADPIMRTTFGQRYRYLSAIVGGGAVAI